VGTQEVAIVALRRHVFRQGFQLGTPEVRVLQNDAVDPLLLNDGPGTLQNIHLTALHIDFQQLKSPGQDLPMVQALQRHRFHVAIHLALHATFPCLPPKEAAVGICL